MIFLPLFLLYPLTLVCIGQPWYVIAFNVAMFFIGFVCWARFCLAWSRRAR